MTRYYTTKYALTVGIDVGEYDAPDETGYVRRVSGPWYSASLKVGRHAFKTLEEASKSAKSDRDRKVASLRKQIERLQQLDLDNITEKKD